jgi:hypothetical protein
MNLFIYCLNHQKGGKNDDEVFYFFMRIGISCNNQ